MRELNTTEREMALGVDSAAAAYASLLQNLATVYETLGGAEDRQRQQQRLYSALLGASTFLNNAPAITTTTSLEKQQQQQKLAALRLIRERAATYDYSSLLLWGGTSPSLQQAAALAAASSAFVSPSSASTCSALSSSSSLSGDVSPTATHLLMGASALGAFAPSGLALQFEQSRKFAQNMQEQQQQQQHKSTERKRRRVVGNLDNTLDGLVAKRVDADPCAKRYRTEKEAIELPDDETEMRRMATDPDVSTRMCSVCGYQGKWVSEMIRHKRVHTSERPFRCKYCNRTSKWKADLIRHVAKTHGIRVVSKYSRSKAYEGGKSPVQHNKNNNYNCNSKNYDNEVNKVTPKRFDDDENNNYATMSIKNDENVEDFVAVSQASKTTLRTTFRCSTCFSEKTSVMNMRDEHDVLPLECLDCRRTFDESHDVKLHDVVTQPLAGSAESSETEQSQQCLPLFIKVNFNRMQDADPCALAMRASMSSSASSSSLSALEHSASKSPDVQANETVRIIVDAANNEKCPNDVVAPSLLPQRPSTSPTAATAAVSSSMPAIDNFGAQLRSCASLNFAVEPGTGVAAMPSDEIAAAISSIKQQRQKQEVQTAQQKLLMLASSILQQQQGGNAPTGQQELQQRYLQSLLQSQQQQFNISPLAVTTNATSSIFSKLNTTVSALSKQPSQMATPSPTLALNLYSQLFDAINKQQQRRE